VDTSLEGVKNSLTHNGRQILWHELQHYHVNSKVVTFLLRIFSRKNFLFWICRTTSFAVYPTLNLRCSNLQTSEFKSSERSTSDGGINFEL